MNHRQVYDSIIKNARSQLRSKTDDYFERHHIVPKSIGGSNKQDNLVLLTPKEHFVCHRLLIEIYRPDKEKYLSMLRAFVMLSSKNKSQSCRYINSRTYENVKRKLYGKNGELTGENATFFGKTHSPETKKALSEAKTGELNHRYKKDPWNKGKTKLTDERVSRYARLQQAHDYNANRQPMSLETKLKLSNIAKENNLGKVKTDQHKESISKKMKELGQTDEFRAQMAKNAQKAKEKMQGISKEKVTCPHCNKTGGKPAMARHHFNNCKEYKE